MRRSGDYLELWKFDCLYDYYGVKTHFLPQIEESDLSQSVPLEASTRKERFGKKKLHPRRDSFCNTPLQRCGDRVVIWSFDNLIACTMTMGSKHTLFPQIAESDPAQSVPLEASTRKQFFERRKLHPRWYSFCNKPLQMCGYRVIIWGFDNLIACTMTMGSKHTSFPQIAESDPAQSVPLEASTRKECFERKKFHPRRWSFCNKPLQTSGDRVIIWRFGNLIGCTMTMGSKHTSFPKWQCQTPLKVCPWKRLLARGVFGEKNSIRGGTRFAIVPLTRAEIRRLLGALEI